MKPLLLSTSDIDGGAARASYRLHQGLRSLGVPSQMLVRAKMSGDPSVIAQKSPITKLGPIANKLPLQLYPHRDRTIFSSQWFPDAIAPAVAKLNPDVVCPQWIGNGFVQIETLAKLNKPLVWTLPDLWSFTGGCHYPQECDRYTNSCGKCPRLQSQRQWDLSHWGWRRKAKVYQQLNLTIVSPSHWLAELARSSSLFKDFRIEVIPHGLNTEVYQPINRQVARQILNLPQDKQLVLFGADSGTFFDLRKGWHLLRGALKKLSQRDRQGQIELAIFGKSKGDRETDLELKAHFLGRFHDDITLALVYAAADVMVVPSIQEAFGQTAIESMACGTPVVAFNANGLKDIVVDRETGYLARPFETEDLAEGIAWVLADSDRLQKLRFHARERIETEFTLELQAHRYLSLFSEILN